jgi:hypothetical protein
MNLSEQRAVSAQRILEDPVYRDSFATVEANIVAKLAQPNTTPETVQELHQSLVSLHRVRRYLEQVIVTGRMDEIAAQQKQATTRRGKQ